MPPIREPEEPVRAREKPRPAAVPNLCPTCTRRNNRPTSRTPETHRKNRVHLCQVCRSELTPEYEAQLPAIKRALRIKSGLEKPA